MDWTKLEKKLARTPLIREVFALAPRSYLVGGYIRDIIAGKTRPKDTDFVLKGNLQDVAQKLARRHRGSVVVLGDEGLTRVVLEDKRTIDLSGYVGEIENDLQGRDFTVNSLAWSPGSGIIDTCNGISDIKQGIIRSFSKGNLKEDPLRMLRAYRLAAQFGWKIERGTRAFIREHARLIESVASERITLEMFKLLEEEYFLAAIAKAFDDGLLELIIQHNNSMLRDNIKQLDELTHDPVYLKKFQEKGFQGLSRAGVLVLSQLLLGFRVEDCRLTLSRKLSRHIKTVNESYNRFSEMNEHDYDELFDCFESAEDASGYLLALCGKRHLIPELKRFMKIQRRPLLGAETIMNVLGIEEGVDVGKVLREIKRRTFNRTLKSRTQAIRYLKSQDSGHKILKVNC